MNDDLEITDPALENNVSVHAGFPNPATDKRLHSLTNRKFRVGF